MHAYFGLAVLNIPAYPVYHPTDPLHDPFPEQALRADQEERERDHVREPVLDRADDERPPVHFAHLLADPDDQPAHDRAGHRGEAAQDEDGERLERHERAAEPHAAPGTPSEPAAGRDDPRHGPD